VASSPAESRQEGQSAGQDPHSILVLLLGGIHPYLCCAFHYDRGFYLLLASLLQLILIVVWVSQETKPTEDRGQQIFFYDDYIDSFKTGYSSSFITQSMTTRCPSNTGLHLVACAAT
jgi:hypothetical protein